MGWSRLLALGRLATVARQIGPTRRDPGAAAADAPHHMDDLAHYIPFGSKRTLCGRPVPAPRADETWRQERCVVCLDLYLAPAAPDATGIRSRPQRNPVPYRGGRWLYRPRS